MFLPHWNPGLVWTAAAIALAGALLLIACLLRNGRLTPYIDRVLDGKEGPPTVIGGQSRADTSG